MPKGSFEFRRFPELGLDYRAQPFCSLLELLAVVRYFLGADVAVGSEDVALSGDSGGSGGLVVILELAHLEDAFNA